MRARHLGATSDSRADERDVELGDGTKEVVSRVQDPDVLRQPEGTQAQATGRCVCGVDDRWDSRTVLEGPSEV